MIYALYEQEQLQISEVMIDSIDIGKQNSLLLICSFLPHGEISLTIKERITFRGVLIRNKSMNKDKALRVILGALSLSSM